MSTACTCGRCYGCRLAWEAGERDEYADARAENIERDERDEELAAYTEQPSSLVPTSIEDPWAWNHFGPDPGDEP